MKKKRRRHLAGRTRNPLKRRAQRGFRGYPVATLAYYGPDDQFASKVAVGIVLEDDGDVAFLERWFSQVMDVRFDPKIIQEIGVFIDQHQVKSAIMTDGIIGCPHEEGIDYPEGENCPQCPYWADRDRWAGELIDEQATEAAEVKTVMGYAWYQADQWERLLEISVDQDKLEQTHAEWLGSAEQAVWDMRSVGIHAESVEVDVEELLAWCRAHDRDVDGAARAQYAAVMLRQRYADHGGGDGD
jgi:hypothetical protein